MPDLADLFPDFAARAVPTEAGSIFTRTGGSGPPLLLLHGFPQTMAMWHRLVPDLARRFTVVLMDLRGYGWSSAPASHEGAMYTKRAMAADAVAVMEEIGHVQFALVGHDRGARVGYRLALDHPGRLTKLALLDILPTVEMWQRIEASGTVAPHWPQLAEPEPAPEQAFGGNPDEAFGGLMIKWSGAKSLDGFDPRAMAHYRAGWNDPSRIHANSDHYRSGARHDRQADTEDLAAGKTIPVPVQVLSSTAYLDKPGQESALDVWRRTFAPAATGETIESGHFLAEENAPATLRALLTFMTA